MPSRNRETVLYNRPVMGRNQIQKGSEDSWVITPKRIEAVNAGAVKMDRPGRSGDTRQRHQRLTPPT